MRCLNFGIWCKKSSIVPYNDNEYLENKSGNELVNIYLNSLEKAWKYFLKELLLFLGI